ncbi:hypothetical protein BCR39DRAFT_518512 [Naematelia encephala]|uniref:AAA+ ATPase domain-containing protein n=1 Tax=Naematelia encephala TaxID=71784 RepID=A0A1Y2BH71_9TREE|nr:hypothetical protein BCR39DRAFT_518512 [Naematelia encephala]
MASPPPLPDPDPSVGPVGARPIYSFWGSARPTVSQAGPSTVPKRKKRKAGEDHGQQKLFAGDINGLNRITAEDGVVVPGTANGEKKKVQVSKKRSSGGGGEEAELRDMTKKGRKGKEEQRSIDGQENRKLGSQPMEGDHDAHVEGALVLAEDKVSTEGTVSSITPSPSKRNRGRPRKSLNTPSNASEEVSIHVHPPESGSSPTEIIITGHISSRPLLSRTASTSSKGAPHDPIDVDSKSGPRKLVFAADKNGTHSFFSRPTSDAALPSVAPPTASEAMVLTGSQNKAAKVHSFFKSARPTGAPGQLKDGWGSTKGGEGSFAPYPRDDWAPAVEVSSLISDPPMNMKRRKLKALDSTVDDDFWLKQLQVCMNESNGHHQASSQTRVSFDIPEHISSHPALSLRPKPAGKSNRDTWADRYRPRAAPEVLGNEVEAVYLRDWLRELSVGNKHGTARKIQRKVKRVKPQFFDGWIVDDIGMFGDAADDSDDDNEIFEEYEEPQLSLGERPNIYPPLELRLTNAILLVGEHGIGKSAAVYAAATELGWDVFEVNPGMGKRTGGSLMSWVGDVGKNHTVINGGGGGSRKTDKKRDLGAFFAKSDEAAMPMPSASQGSQAEPIDLDDDDGKHNGDHEDTFRQSMILIEEADILFTEENTFWPAVISLIAESRRPVVLTCNDVQRIPVDQLPLQAILRFHPPPSYLAIPYLERIATRESITEPRYAADLYESCMIKSSTDRDQPVVPNGNEGLLHFDLRRALMQMQLDRQSSCGLPSTQTAVQETELGKLVRRLEIVSFADAFVAPRDWAKMDVTEIDRHESGADDELGVLALVKPELPDRICYLPAYDYSDEMASTLIDMSGGYLPPIGDLHTARVQYIRSLLPMLDPLIPLSAHLFPHPSLFLDHLPIIRTIVEADDAMQAAEDAEVANGGNRVNKKTGRAIRISAAGILGREKYERYFDIPIGELEEFRRTKLE